MLRSLLDGLFEDDIGLSHGPGSAALYPEGAVRIDLGLVRSLRHCLSVAGAAGPPPGRLQRGTGDHGARGHGVQRRQGRLVAVRAVQAHRASSQLPRQEGPELEGRSQLHAHRARQVLLREEGQGCAVDSVFSKVLQSKEHCPVLDGDH